MPSADIIALDHVSSLAELFQQRVQRTPQATAYRQFNYESKQWEDFTWQEMADAIALWQTALQQESLQATDKVAILLPNCREWVMIDQACQHLGLVTIPLYTNDRADNISYILNDADVKVLFISNAEDWQKLQPVLPKLSQLQTVISLAPIDTQKFSKDQRLKNLYQWLPNKPQAQTITVDKHSLATIVYTSGTTGKPKGVMLSHYNILWNAWSSLQSITVYPSDLLLSFLPLSHTLERTIGYYLPIMAGATVAYARSVPQLSEDLLVIRPTLLVAVPRIFERVYNKITQQLPQKSPLAQKLFHTTTTIGWQYFLYQQGRYPWQANFLLWPILSQLVAKKIQAKLGGRLRIAISGGAALACQISQLFIGLGVTICQGYGLTETSPVISVNPLENNHPSSVGMLIKDVEIKSGQHQELLVKSPGVMLGYWHQAEATAQIIDEQAWLHTGDQAILDDEHLYITGRLKEIIVLANGEKIPPADMETSIALDPLFEQVMVIGENRPYLVALLVINTEIWPKFLQGYQLSHDFNTNNMSVDLEKVLLSRIADKIQEFPGYAKIRRCRITDQVWTIEQGFLTPTLKLKRNKLLAHYQAQIETLYQGH